MKVITNNEKFDNNNVNYRISENEIKDHLGTSPSNVIIIKYPFRAIFN